MCSRDDDPTQHDHLEDQPPVPGGTTAIRDGQYVTEERAPGPPSRHNAAAPAEGLREAAQEAFIDAFDAVAKVIEPFDIKGLDESWDRLRDAARALAAPAEGLDVERWMAARHHVLHPQHDVGAEGCLCLDEQETVIAIAREYAAIKEAS